MHFPVVMNDRLYMIRSKDLIYRSIFRFTFGASTSGAFFTLAALSALIFFRR